MTAVGITGHQALPDVAIRFAASAIEELLAQAVAQIEPVTGFSSLAKGADQIFAQHILRIGASLHAVIPCRNYETTFSSQAERREYGTLLAKANAVETLDYDEPSDTAYYEAGKAIVRACDWLIAVWDGQPARGLGGTGDVVIYAHQLGRRVEVLWPRGLTR